MADIIQDISNKEAILKDPNLEPFQKKLIYGTVMNMEAQGENIKVNPGGKNYLFFDGQKGWIPTVVANILNNTGRWVPVKKRNNNANLDQGETIKKEFRKRFSFVPSSPDGEDSVVDEELEKAKEEARVAAGIADAAVKAVEKTSEENEDLQKENEELRKELEALRGGEFTEDGSGMENFGQQGPAVEPADQEKEGE